MRNITQLTVALVVVFGVLGLPVVADEYYVEYGDGDWNDGVSSHGSSGLGSSDSRHNVPNGWVRVESEVTGVGDALANSTIYKDFTYDSTHDYQNRFKLVCRLDGEMDHTGGADNAFSVKVELWDLTDPELLHTHTEVNKQTEEWAAAEDLVIIFKHVLEDGHEYRVKLMARASCETSSLGTAIVDFLSDGNGYRIDWDFLSVKHSHAATTTEGGTKSGSPSNGEYSLTQWEYDEADRLQFASYNSTGDINGWSIEITDFTNSSSTRDGEREVDVEAWGNVIPRNYTVDITVDNWIGSGCDNTKGLRNVEWQEGGKRGWSKAMPGFLWDVGEPVEVIEPAGFYSHAFTMTNTDTLSDLRISGLTFLATEEWYEELSAIEFTGPLYDFDVPIGLTWPIDIITEGSLRGGYLYFRYSVYNEAGDAVVCNAWGCHLICPLLADMNFDESVNADDIPSFVDLLLHGTTEPGLFYAADVEMDGELNGLDIAPFVTCVLDEGCL